MIVRDGPYRQLWCQLCDGAVISTAVTANCSLVCAATVRRRAYLFDGEGKALWETPLVLEDEGWATAISEDGGTIAIGTARKRPAGGRVYVVDQLGRVLWSYAMRAPVWSVALSADGEWLAVACWNNTAYRFRRKGTAHYDLEASCTIEEAHGLYGIALSADGQFGAVAAYDVGVALLGPDFNVTHTAPLKTGIYNLNLRGAEVVAGLRDGGVAILSTRAPYELTIVPRIAKRPVCGADATSDGSILTLGSFDGRVYVSDRAGRPIWVHTTDGEVWSTSLSGDGQLVCIGSGDHTVRLFANHASPAVLQEISAVERSLETSDGTQLETMLTRLVRLYLAHGVVDYGRDHLKSLLADSASPHILRRYLQELLTSDIEAYPRHHASHFELAKLLAESQQYFEAAYHFQQAANEPDLESRALALAGDCFAALRLGTATSSCYRRARARHLDADAERILYNLGCAYEEKQSFVEAARHFEQLVSWNARYRDTWQRLSRLAWLNSGARAPSVPPAPLNAAASQSQSQGSFLGPDAPRLGESDESLAAVLRGRASEILITPEERTRLEEILKSLVGDEEYMRGITGYGLEYTTAAYLKYDYSLPEDEIKKLLESVHLLYSLEGHAVGSSLDIGAATGRYPTLFFRRGVAATGIDREAQAIEYANQKLAGRPGPTMIVGDARSLPFEPATFDLVTCMMGTFAHIPREDHRLVLENVLRVLKPGGRFVVSTWDVDCEHITYLSMYSETQKEEIRANSLRQKEIAALFSAAGFNGVFTRPFCLLPQLFVYDLALEKLTPRDLQMAVDIDITARAMLADRHGELYLAGGTKPLGP